MEQNGRFEEHNHKERDYSELIKELHKLRRLIMATKAEVLEAIANEKAQVLVGIEELNKQIEDLKAQITNGVPVTAADLDEIVNAVHDIFVPVEKA
jgi:hypothetical protein